MVNLRDAVSLLRAKRKELLDQLDAVDKAARGARQSKYRFHNTRRCQSSGGCRSGSERGPSNKAKVAAGAER